MLTRPEFYEVFAYLRSESAKYEGDVCFFANLHKCCVAFGAHQGYGPSPSECGAFVTGESEA